MNKIDVVVKVKQAGLHEEAQFLMEEFARQNRRIEKLESLLRKSYRAMEELLVATDELDEVFKAVEADME